MSQEGEKKLIIQIIGGLTALIEHSPEETIKTAMIEGIKEKTQVLKDQDKIIPVRNNSAWPRWENILLSEGEFTEVYKKQWLEDYIKEGWRVLNKELAKVKNERPKVPDIPIKTNNLGFAEGKEGEEAQEIKTGPQPAETGEPKKQPEILRFGDYIKSLHFSFLRSKTIEEHYQDFKQS